VVLDLDHRPAAWTTPDEAAAQTLRAARAADIVVGNDEEFGLLAGAQDRGEGLARDLAQDGALFIVYKRGALGSVTFAGDRRLATGIFPVAARKPMGAGDGFLGGLLAGLAAGHDLETAVTRGAATAAIIVAGIGCAPASPDRAQVDAFLHFG
jgi:5-dehydro-2-deoxygluconokinase